MEETNINDFTTIRVKKTTRDKLNIVINMFEGINQNTIIEYFANTIIMNENLFDLDFKNKQLKIRN
jgi:hypothetical protein